MGALCEIMNDSLQFVNFLKMYRFFICVECVYILSDVGFDCICLE